MSGISWLPYDFIMILLDTHRATDPIISCDTTGHWPSSPG